MTDQVTLLRQQGIGILRIENPPVNALSLAIVAALRASVAQAAADSDIKALVICAAGSTFPAGADASEFTRPDYTNTSFNALMQEVEALGVPVVAVLHGTALGGGLELALASHYRVALPRTRIGLPEVHLGVLPGAGGTQRLPRLAGAELALDLISSGRMIDAKAALAAGIVDEIADGDPQQVGIDFARKLLADGKGVRRTSGQTAPGATPPAGFFGKALEAARKRSGYPAAERIVQCVEAAVTKPFAEGLALENRLFNELRASPQSAALRHLFFAQREAARIPGLAADTPLRSIKRVGVVGAGTMGGGIAMNFVNAGIPTVVVETTQAALDRGLGIVRKNYEATAAKGRITTAQVEERMGLLHGAVGMQALADCDLVVEAVFENLEVKLKVCEELGRVCKPGAIIASNTSTLDIDVLARASGRPREMLGMHFFSPANVMRLLEVVRGADTAPDVLATVMKLARTIGKVAAVSGVCYGFIGNRMLESYLREADFLLMEGASPAQIDRAIESLGLAMGPCRMLDMAGTDVAAKVVLERGKAGDLPDDASYRAVVRKLFDLGRHGQKTGKGYYRYEGRTPVEDAEVAALCKALAAEHHIAQRSDITDQEIIERCLYPLINEGVLILEEGIAYRPGDIDVVWANGYGFPDYRGGPLFMADTIGLPVIAAAMEGYGKSRGDTLGYWRVAPLLARLAASKERVSDSSGVNTTNIKERSKQ